MILKPGRKESSDVLPFHQSFSDDFNCRGMQVSPEALCIGTLPDSKTWETDTRTQRGQGRRSNLTPGGKTMHDGDIPRFAFRGAPMNYHDELSLHWDRSLKFSRIEADSNSRLFPLTPKQSSCLISWEQSSPRAALLSALPFENFWKSFYPYGGGQKSIKAVFTLKWSTFFHLLPYSIVS